ncbi:MAG TPA: NADH-quinone oxidoreductase subunit J [Bryobacteraceae bacterium]|nr:NADH-quinone oxidoreductase subunit J [Bryobacteraceae bacterium]
MVPVLLFYFFSLLAIGGGILTVTRRSVVVSGVWLIVSLLGVAGLFLLEGAEFLFVAQLILYVGGIILLFLIAVMLVNFNAAVYTRRFRNGWPAVLSICLLLAAELLALLSAGRFAAPVTPAPGLPNADAVADALLSKYLVAFELASVVLLAAVVGAVLMGQKRKEHAS